MESLLAGRWLPPAPGFYRGVPRFDATEVTHIAQIANPRYGKLVASDEKAPGKCAKFAIKNLDSAPAGSSSHVQNSATLSAFPLDFSRSICGPTQGLSDQSLAAHCLCASCRPACAGPVRAYLRQLQSNKPARFGRLPSL